MRLPLLASWVCLLAACQGPGVAEVRLPLAEGLATPAAFPGARAILDGFDGAVGADLATWQAGDEVLFGLRLCRDGEVRHWLLHLRLIEPIAIARPGDDVPPPAALPHLMWSLRVNGVDQEFVSAACRVLATVCDADGNVLGRSEPVLPRDFLARGFTRACERVAARHGRVARSRDADDRAAATDVQPFAEATVAAVALLQVVQEDTVLAPLLWQVVDRPSLWSVVSHLGARVLLRPAFERAAPAPSPVAMAPIAWRVPLALSVNDQPVLQTDLFVVPAARPLALCAGVVGAIARHPRHADREFSLVLLAARVARDRPPR